MWAERGPVSPVTKELLVGIVPSLFQGVCGIVLPEAFWFTGHAGKTACLNATLLLNIPASHAKAAVQREGFQPSLFPSLLTLHQEILRQALGVVMVSKQGIYSNATFYFLNI